MGDVTTYVAPQENAPAFTCPHCGVMAAFTPTAVVQIATPLTAATRFCQNDACGRPVVWFGDIRPSAVEKTLGFVASRMVYPDGVGGPIPSADLPEKVASLMNEARAVMGSSPRAACALCRVALQQFLMEQGYAADRLDQQIKSLVEGDVPKRVQRALDIVRITGNAAAHPGEIIFDDPEQSRATAIELMDLLNFLASELISGERELERMYKRLPPAKREAIARRDGSPS